MGGISSKDYVSLTERSYQKSQNFHELSKNDEQERQLGNFIRDQPYIYINKNEHDKRVVKRVYIFPSETLNLYKSQFGKLEELPNVPIHDISNTVEGKHENLFYAVEFSDKLLVILYNIETNSSTSVQLRVNCLHANSLNTYLALEKMSDDPEETFFEFFNSPFNAVEKTVTNKKKIQDKIVKTVSYRRDELGVYVQFPNVPEITSQDKIAHKQFVDEDDCSRCVGRLTRDVLIWYFELQRIHDNVTLLIDNKKQPKLQNFDHFNYNTLFTLDIIVDHKYKSMLQVQKAEDKIEFDFYIRYDEQFVNKIVESMYNPLKHFIIYIANFKLNKNMANSHVSEEECAVLIMYNKSNRYVEIYTPHKHFEYMNTLISLIAYDINTKLGVPDIVYQWLYLPVNYLQNENDNLDRFYFMLWLLQLRIDNLGTTHDPDELMKRIVSKSGFSSSTLEDVETYTKNHKMKIKQYVFSMLKTQTESDDFQVINAEYHNHIMKLLTMYNVKLMSYTLNLSDYKLVIFDADKNLIHKVQKPLYFFICKDNNLYRSKTNFRRFDMVFPFGLPTKYLNVEGLSYTLNEYLNFTKKYFDMEKRKIKAYERNLLRRKYSIYLLTLLWYVLTFDAFLTSFTFVYDYASGTFDDNDKNSIRYFSVIGNVKEIQHWLYELGESIKHAFSDLDSWIHDHHTESSHSHSHTTPEKPDEHTSGSSNNFLEKVGKFFHDIPSNIKYFFTDIVTPVWNDYILKYAKEKHIVDEHDRLTAGGVVAIIAQIFITVMTIKISKHVTSSQTKAELKILEHQTSIFTTKGDEKRLSEVEQKQLDKKKIEQLIHDHVTQQVIIPSIYVDEFMKLVKSEKEEYLFANFYTDQVMMYTIKKQNKKQQK